jgi:hypothetical protein
MRMKREKRSGREKERMAAVMMIAQTPMKTLDQRNSNIMMLKKMERQRQREREREEVSEGEDLAIPRGLECWPKVSPLLAEHPPQQIREQNPLLGVKRPD